MFDVHKCDFAVDNDGGRGALILCIQNQRKELVNHVLVYITTIVAADEYLNNKMEMSHNDIQVVKGDIQEEELKLTKQD